MDHPGQKVNKQTNEVKKGKVENQSYHKCSYTSLFQNDAINIAEDKLNVNTSISVMQNMF